MKMLPLKMRPLFALLIFVSLLSSNFSVLPCRAQKPDAPPLFLEDFSHADAVAGRWEEVTNGGTMRVSEHRLTLLGNGGKGFPVLTTRTSPFPRSGDWTVSFGYRYTSIGNYGTDLSCDQAGGNKVIMIHQDISSQVLALNGTVIAHMPANTDWHVISVAKVGSRIAAFVDGKESEAVEGGKKLDGGDLGTAPAAIRLGGSLQTNPWDWNDLQIQFVRVDAGLHPLSLNALQMLPAALPADSGAPGKMPAGSNTTTDNNTAGKSAAEKSAADKNPSALNGFVALPKVPAPASLLEDAKPEAVKYKIVNLGAFPTALHTNWFLELEVSNESDATVSAVDIQLDLLFGDASKLPLTIYDPDKSYPAGYYLKMKSPSLESYDIKAHTKKLFHAYFIDSDLISDNYRGQAHRADGLIVTAADKRVAVLTVHGF